MFHDTTACIFVVDIFYLVLILFSFRSYGRPQVFPKTSCRLETPGRGEKINGWAPKLSSLSCNLSSPSRPSRRRRRPFIFQRGVYSTRFLLLARKMPKSAGGWVTVSNGKYHTSPPPCPPPLTLRHVFFFPGTFYFLLIYFFASCSQENNHTRPPWPDGQRNLPFNTRKRPSRRY